jgi:hypothetical protein
MLCVASHISISELARRLNTTPQNMNAKLKRQSFSIPDLERIAEATGSKFERKFILADGDEIKNERSI